MQILLVTDIHANLRALQAVFKRYSAADEIWCLGDIGDACLGGGDARVTLSAGRQRTLSAVIEKRTDTNQRGFGLMSGRRRRWKRDWLGGHAKGLPDGTRPILYT